MPTEIQYTKKALKGRDTLTANERAILDALEQDLRETPGKPLGGKAWGRFANTGMMPTIAT